MGFRMHREVRPYDLPSANLKQAEDEGFEKGAYKLPRIVRRFLRSRMEPYAGRPRMMMAIHRLAWIVGRFHCGTENFIPRGLSAGPSGSGFFLCRAPLAAKYPDLSEALIREGVRFLLEIGFIERVTPRGELQEVKKPRNSKKPMGYFRTALIAAKDAVGQIRSPKVFYRLGRAARDLFAKILSSTSPEVQSFLQQEPECRDSSLLVSGIPGGIVERVHSGSSASAPAPYDVAGHDPADPRFDRWKPNTQVDPRWKPGWRHAPKRPVAPSRVSAVIAPEAPVPQADPIAQARVDALKADLAMREARRLARTAVPEPVEPVQSPVAAPKPPSSFNAHLAAVLAAVGVNPVKPVQVNEDAATEEWGKPMLTSLVHRSMAPWLAEWESVEELTRKRYPKIFSDHSNAIRREVLDWLSNQMGSGGVGYGFKSVYPLGDRRIFLGFRLPQNAFAFRMQWGGV